MVRALSNSSELSVASADSGRDNDEQHMDFIMSGPNTPFGERTQQDAMTSAPSETNKTRAVRGKLLVIYFILFHHRFCFVRPPARSNPAHSAPLDPSFSSVPTDGTPRWRRTWLRTDRAGCVPLPHQRSPVLRWREPLPFLFYQSPRFISPAFCYCPLRQPSVTPTSAGRRGRLGWTSMAVIAAPRGRSGELCCSQVARSSPCRRGTVNSLYGGGS